MNTTDFSKNTRYTIIILIVWAIIEVVLFKIYGIHTDLEAAKYIYQADYFIKNGTVETGNYWFYSVQIFLIVLVKKFHLPYLIVVIIQWTASLIAVLSMYRYISRFINNQTAFLVSIYFLFNIPSFIFNSYLQTDSLFFSLTIIFSCYLLKLEKLTPITWLKIILFLFIICFIRPTGLFWIPPTLLFLFFKFFKKISLAVKFIICFVAAIGFVAFLNLAMGSGGELDFMLPFRDERIICGVPTLSHNADIKTSANPNSLQGILYYIMHNFNQFCRMALLHTQAFWGLLRNYYNFGHNLYLAFVYYPLYILALYSIPFWIKRNKNGFLYFGIVILITWMSVVLSCDDWHNRFFLSIVPYIYILSAPAIKKIFDKIKPNVNGESP